MYSSRRTITKSSSNIPVRVAHSSRANVHSESSELHGDGMVMNAVEAASECSKDSGYTENETIKETGSEVQVHSSRNSFSAVSSSRSFTTTELRLELDEDVGENDDFLKEELMHIFERERSTLELYFKNKMDDLLLRFRKNQMEWEEASRADKADMENAFTQEKTAMQRSFGEEIAKLTRTFNEERSQLELYYKAQLTELKDQARREQTDAEAKTAREKVELKEKLDAEYQAMLKSELAEAVKGSATDKAELQAQLRQDKEELEREHRLQLTKEEAKLQQVTTEMESNFQQERLELEQDFRQKLAQMEETLHQEREIRYGMQRQLEQERKLRHESEKQLEQERKLRHETEKQLDQERVNGSSTDSNRKQEIERLKSEIAQLRHELDENNRSVAVEVRTLEERTWQGGRDGLSGALRSDSEGLRAEHKMGQERSYQKDGETLEEEKREKIRIEMGKERQWSKETNARENGEQTVTGEQGQDFFYVSPKNENALRIEINGLRSENDGLKAKVAALEENIELHKKYKTEAQAEIERLQQAHAEHSTENEHLFKLQMEKELRDAQSKSRDYERKLKELRAQVKEKERAQVKERERAGTKADRNSRDVEAKVAELEKRIQILEEMAKEADARAKHAEEQLKESKLRMDNISTMRTKGDKRFLGGQNEVEEDWRPVEDYQPDTEKAKHETASSERNKLLRVIKEQQRNIHHLQEKLRTQQESGGLESGMTEQSKATAEHARHEQQVQELRVKLQQLLERFKLEKQKVSSLEEELSSAKSKYGDQTRLLEEVQRTAHVTRAERDRDRDSLRRIEKEMRSMREMLKTHSNEKGRELSNMSVDQSERIWKLQMEKQELELKLKMAREAMHEYVIKLNEKIKDMESGERPLDVMIQELHTRNGHLKATLKALEREQMRSQFQNVELAQQKTELQTLIGKLCPDDALTCFSRGASPRVHVDKNRLICGDHGGSDHHQHGKHESWRGSDPHQHSKHESWRGKSARDDATEGLQSAGTDGLNAGFSSGNKYGSDSSSFMGGQYSSRGGSRQLGGEQYGTNQYSTSALEQVHSQRSTENSPISARRSKENFYDLRKKEDQHDSYHTNTGNLKTFQYSVSSLEN